MMKRKSEVGEGEEITVGSGLGVPVVEQDVSNMASK
jgi:hypothetical protein